MSHALRFAIAALALLGPLAQARQCRSLEFPEHIRVDGTELTLNGLGVRKATFLKINVYVAALYVVRPSRDASVLIDSKDPQEMTLRFVRAVGVSDLRKAWSEGFERSAGAQLPPLQPRIAKLNEWMSDMQVGGRLTFIRRAGTIEVSVNDSAKGTIEGEDFARALVAIWLGPTPPNPEVKNGLLGGVCE